MIENTQQQQIPTPMPQPVLNPPKPMLPIILALIIVALVSGGGVYLWQQGEIKKLQTVSQQPTGNFGNIETQTLQPTIKTNTSPAPDLTKDWKNYTNQKFGFSLKYPTQWVEIIENANPWDVVGFSGNKSGQSDIFISVVDNPKNLSLKDYYKNESETSDMVLPNPFNGSETYLTVGGKQAVKLGIPGAIANEEVAVLLDKKIFKIARHLDGNKEVELTFGSVLNTIKFSTSITEVNKTFTNDKYGLRFDYPKNLVVDTTSKFPAIVKVISGGVELLTFNQVGEGEFSFPVAMKETDFIRVNDKIVRKKDHGSWNYYETVQKKTCSIYEEKSDGSSTPVKEITNNQGGYQCYNYLLGSKNISVGLNQSLTTDKLAEADEVISSIQ